MLGLIFLDDAQLIKDGSGQTTLGRMTLRRITNTRMMPSRMTLRKIKLKNGIQSNYQCVK
jgi:hypothetical protein